MTRNDDARAPDEHRAGRSTRSSAVDDPYEGVYLVGGTVRDILLGEPNFDVDVVVEGDAIALADDACRRSSTDACARTRSSAPPSSSTATTSASTSSRPAASRTTRPAALPTVEPGTIDEDLHRRDFTINAMAVVARRARTSASSSTPSAAAPTSRPDSIRVLHDRSFIDDPTRILRAIRYEDRYGFRMDEHTAAARPRVHRDRPRRRPLGRAPPRRADRAPRGGRRQPRDPAAGRARRREGDPSARRRRRRGRRASSTVFAS